MSFSRKSLFASLVLIVASLGPETRLWAQGGGFAYVANLYSGNVSAYTIDATTGALTPVSGSPFRAGTSPFFVTVHPTGKFIYVANINSSNVSAYAIEAMTGVLTPVPGSPFPTGNPAQAVAVDPTGQFLYVAMQSAIDSSGSVAAFTIDAATGALTLVPGSPFPAGVYSRWITVDPTGQFVYTANVYSRDVSAFSIDPATGALTPVLGSPFPVGNYANSVAVDPTGRFLYVTTSSGVAAFTVDAVTGALTTVPGSPFPGAGGDGVTDPSGQFVYVANGAVSAYTIDAGSGALTPVPGSPFATGDWAGGVAVDPTGQFLYVTTQAQGTYSGSVAAFTIDVATGALAAVPGSPFPAGVAASTVATTAGPPPLATLRLRDLSLAYGERLNRRLP